MWKEKEYDMVLEIPNLVNRTSLIEQFLDVLRWELFNAIAENNEAEISRVDKKILKFKNELKWNNEKYGHSDT